MAAHNRFQDRLGEMESVRVSPGFKRKRNDFPNIPSLLFKGRDRESVLLGPLEKRKKFAQFWNPWEVRGQSPSLLPRSVQPLSRDRSSSLQQGLPDSSRRNTVDDFHPSVQTFHSTGRFLQMSGGIVPSTASKLVDFAPSSGNCTLLRGPADFRVSLRLRPGQADSGFHRLSNTHSLPGNREGSENLNRVHARNLERNDISIKKFTELLDSSVLATNAEDLRSADGRMHGNHLEESSMSTRDDTSQAPLSDKDEVPTWKKLFSEANNPSKAEKMRARRDDIGCLEAELEGLRISRPPAIRLEKEPAEDPKLTDAFTPLSREAEHKVNEALRGLDRNKVLVLHEKSNIEVTTTVMQCLLPGAWLNDEVINVYMELLKEREASEPDRFLKCHFFNTFFYNKLFKDKRSYDYKAIRRWTTQRKLGYSLSDCDKILVPIHQDIHWCLAVINIRDKKLEYLDSLKGSDVAVLRILAKYISDEAKDKDGKDLDTAKWDLEYPESIPEQLNGCDCGMFMLKYADFHSRDAPLHFTQEDMPYFRKKMVWEILNLKAT